MSISFWKKKDIGLNLNQWQHFTSPNSLSTKSFAFFKEDFVQCPIVKVDMKYMILRVKYAGMIRERICSLQLN